MTPHYNPAISLASIFTPYVSPTLQPVLSNVDWSIDAIWILLDYPTIRDWLHDQRYDYAKELAYGHTIEYYQVPRTFLHSSSRLWVALVDSIPLKTHFSLFAVARRVAHDHARALNSHE